MSDLVLVADSRHYPIQRLIGIEQIMEERPDLDLGTEALNEYNHGNLDRTPVNAPERDIFTALNDLPPDLRRHIYDCLLLKLDMSTYHPIIDIFYGQNYRDGRLYAYEMLEQHVEEEGIFSADIGWYVSADCNVRHEQLLYEYGMASAILRFIVAGIGEENRSIVEELRNVLVGEEDDSDGTDSGNTSFVAVMEQMDIHAICTTLDLPTGFLGAPSEASVPHMVGFASQTWGDPHADTIDDLLSEVERRPSCETAYSRRNDSPEESRRSANTFASIPEPDHLPPKQYLAHPRHRSTAFTDRLVVIIQDQLLRDGIGQDLISTIRLTV